jgi:hypothetical protein
MIVKTPVPYGRSSLTNSPLDGSGSDFPCKQRPGVYDAEGASNVMAIGEPQTLSFTGSAVHGGGSCQISLSTDLQPTKGSKWMVIKSIEGGCPSSAAGNLKEDANGSGADTFQYTIPEGIAPGDYTIAWTWMNKIGNREFYMNCGPATVTAAKKKRYNPNPIVRRQSQFPDLFVANLVSVNSCKTPEGSDYIYPNPGDVVQSAGTGPYTALACGAAGGSGPAAQPTQTGAAAGGTGAPAVASSAPTAAATNGSGTPATPPISAGVFASGAASAAPSIATVQPGEPAATSAPAAPASTGGTSSSSSSSSSSSGSQTAGAACSDEGAWACAADNSSFQRCASGTWTVPMAVPQGMSAVCDGASGFSMIAKAGKMKRVVRTSEDGLFDRYEN